MQRSNDRTQRRSIEWRAFAAVGAVLLGLVAVGRPNVAAAGPHGGGGGFHGGGMAAAGGFHGGGFGGAGGFHGGVGAMRGSAGHLADFSGGHGRGGDRREGVWTRDGHDWDGRHVGWWWGGAGGWPYYGYNPYAYSSDYSYSQPVAQPNYYCADPPGYYPEISQCPIGWQLAPAG